MGKFKMKGFKAFDMEKNSNNRPDGRAGSSVFQIAGKVYNKFSTSPNKIGELESKEAPQPKMRVKDAQIKRPTKTKEVAGGRKLIKKSGEKSITRLTPRVKVKKENSPMDIAMRSVGSDNRLKTRPVRKRKDSSDPFKVANQYRRHSSSKSERVDAMARKRMIDRKYADRSAKERAMLANTSQYKSYGAKDEFKKMREQGNFPFGTGRQTAKADSPNKIGAVVSKAPKIAKAIGKTIAGTVGKMTGSNESTNYKDIMKKDNPNIYNIREHKQKQPGGGMGTVVTYQIKGQKGEYAVAKSRLLERMAKSRK